jgi:hypothetical protein
MLTLEVQFLCYQFLLLKEFDVACLDHIFSVGRPDQELLASIRNISKECSNSRFVYKLVSSKVLWNRFPFYVGMNLTALDSNVVYVWDSSCKSFIWTNKVIVNDWSIRCPISNVDACLARLYPEFC